MAYESRLSLTVDSRTGERRLKSFRGELERTDKQGRRLAGGLAQVTRAAVGLSGALSGLAVGRFFAGSIKNVADFEARLKSMGSVIQATGRSAGFTVDTLREQADEIALATLQNTEGVLEAQRVMLSFRSVNRATFLDAIRLSADLSTVFGTSMSQAAAQLGKALEDPVQGITALRRSGVSFTEDQKELIKSLVETNRLGQAQAMILGEIRKQVGGAGEGEASGLAGAFDTLQQRVDEFGRVMGAAANESGRLERFITRMAAGLDKINEELAPDNAERAFQLLQEEIDLKAKLAQLNENAGLHGAPGAEVEALERRINEVRAERLALLEKEAKAQEDQAAAIIASREAEKRAEEERRAAELRRQQEEQRKKLEEAEADRLAAVGGITEQLQAEYLALTLTERQLLQHELAVAGATERERELALATYDANKQLRDQADAAEAAKEAAENWVNPFEDAAQSVAQSLQNAIASGDWDNIGDAIGGTLGASAAAMLNKSITDSLSGSVNAQSGMLSQLGAAFAGPIAGAVVGGAVQLAISELDDYFGDDWDPTEARQRAQGTGTVLADMNAKSESIRRAVEGSESGIGQLVGINQSMLQALRSVQTGILGASSRIARGASGVSIGSPSAMSGSDLAANLTGGALPVFDTTAELAFDFFDAVGEIFTFGALDLDGLLGGKVKKRDEGIRIVGGYISDLIDETLVEAYATFRVKKHAFDDYDTKERFERLGGDVAQQFALVFGSVYDSVEAGVGALGLDFDRLARGFEVETQRISLEGLSASEQQAELEAYFGTVFDNLAGYTVPWLDEFQQAGEGLGETLARVANQTMVAQEAVTRLGIRFSDLAGRELVTASARLMDAAGGVEQFISSMQGFIDNFATDAQKFELAYSDINRALAQANLTLPKTREQYYDLLRAQDGATAAGADNIATLLRLQGVADEFYTFLEDAQTDALDAQRELMTAQREAIGDTLRETERAADSIARALDGLAVSGSRFEAASRARALSSLDTMARTGRIGSQDELDRAITGATNISAGSFGSMSDYVREVARTGAVLTRLQAVTGNKQTAEQRALNAIERSIAQLQEESAAQQRAIAKHTAKTAKILERMEVEDQTP